MTTGGTGNEGAGQAGPARKAEKAINPWLKIALELGPVILFFAAFSRFKDQTVTIWGNDYGGFIVATLAFVPVLVLTTLILWWLTGKLSAMQIVTLVLVVVFGGLSVWFNDPRFFKMKVTIIYLLFAGALWFGLWRGRSYLALVMADAFPMRTEGWMILTRRMALLFTGLAIANEIIWRGFSEEVWVDFKTFALPGIMMLFFVSQAKLLEAHRPDDGADG